MTVVIRCSLHAGVRRLAVALSCGLTLAVFAETSSADLIYGINHTHWAINRFSVDGHPAIDIIGPYQGGGGGGGYFAPKHWSPGMSVRVDWERGLGGSKGFPGFADWPIYEAWVEKMEAQNRQLSKLVSVPDYTGEKTCGIAVHFLPCDELQVTTSCYRYGNPEYPNKTPLHLPEPTSCPQ